MKRLVTGLLTALLACAALAAPDDARRVTRASMLVTGWIEVSPDCTAAEHYIFGRYLGSGGAGGFDGYTTAAAYLATGSLWNFGYQGMKQHGVFPHASRASFMQLTWESNGYLDSIIPIDSLKAFKGAPGSACGCNGK
jgi:hypothetical protein